MFFDVRQTEIENGKGEVIVERIWEQRVYVVYVVTAGCSTRCVFQPLLPELPLSEPKYEWQLILLLLILVESARGLS